MPILNANIPYFKIYIRSEFLYNLEAHWGEFIPGYVFGVSSLPARALGWHVMTENGGIFWRLPIHALALSKNSPKMKLEELQLWDNISSEISITEFTFLKNSLCRVFINKMQFRGRYLFTIDYFNSPDADSPDEHKCSHILALDNGNLAAQPNNRILWDITGFTETKEKPDWKINTHKWICADNVEIENTDRFFYGDR